MRRLLSSVAIVAALAFPVVAIAMPPPGVTGITADFTDGQIHVRWNPAGAEDIAFYRVYYARRSILQAGGQYDDFETVDGKVTNYIVKNVPDAPELFVSVLAVNTTLEESDYFAEEVKVNLSEGNTSGTTETQTGPAESPSRRELNASTLGLLSAVQTSPTTVTLAFSHDVVLKPADGMQAFTIRDGAGNALSLHRLVIDGSTVEIMTGPQVRGQEYRVTASSVLSGRSEAGTSLPLDQSRSTQAFTALDGIDGPIVTIGASSSSAQSSAATVTASSGSRITNLRLAVEPDRGSYSRVTVAWESTIPEAELTGFVVRAEREGQELSVSKGERTMLFTGVAPGTFRVTVRAVTTDGKTDSASASTVTQRGTAVTKGSTGLPGTGPGIAFLAGMSGGLALWLKKHRGSAVAKNRN